MSKFKCKCLNVTVHVKEKATREADGKAFVSEPDKSPFFSQELFEVELAVGGITKVMILLGSLARNFEVQNHKATSAVMKIYFNTSFFVDNPSKVWRAFLSPRPRRSRLHCLPSVFVILLCVLFHFL